MAYVGECVALYGDAEIVQRDPSLLAFQDALYVPFDHPRSPAGIFDVGRRCVLSGAYFRGPNLDFPAMTTPLRYSDVKSEAAEDAFIYGGYLHSHFGHYLLSSFSRLWPYVFDDFDRSPLIAVHTSDAGAAQYFAARPWATELIGAIGLTPNNFVTFVEPTRLRSLIVPAPSFEECSFAHRAFADLCHRAGDTLRAKVDRGATRPAYLSKEKLGSGVRKVVNEDEVSGFLADRGFDILFPETMSLAHQAAFWRDRDLVAGIVGSGLHASILAPGKAVIAVSDSRALVSNFALIDRVNNASATYLGLDEGALIQEPDDPSFSQLTRLRDPIGLAETLLREADRMMAGH